MDFLSSFSKNDESKPVSGDQHPNKPNHHKPSRSDLLHSAKVVTDAAGAHFRREPEKYDKSELAGATADLLDAASEYGKLDDKAGVGKYVDKAEDYLRKYHSSHSGGHAGKPGEHKSSGGAGGEGHYGGGGSGGHGDGEKKKPSDHGGEGHGSGDFLKMAGDYLKK